MISFILSEVLFARRQASRTFVIQRRAVLLKTMLFFECFISGINVMIMKHKRTPKPGSKEYNVEKTEDLNMPEFHSSTDKRDSRELPAIENMNGKEASTGKAKTDPERLPDTNLGNDRSKNEKERERIIRK
jgi:hypothetical protein